MRARLCRPDGAVPAGLAGSRRDFDIMGFSPDRRIARRFADSGYAALAPALYDGAGAPPLCVARTVRDMSRGDGPAFERLEDARRFLAAQPGIDGNRIGVTGFCMGGGFALYWAARGGLQVCAPFYGQVPEQAEDLRRVCPVVASFGELDQPFLARAAAQHPGRARGAARLQMYPGSATRSNDHGGGPLAALERRTKMRGLRPGRRRGRVGPHARLR